MYIKIPPFGPVTFLTQDQFHSQDLDLEHATIDDIGPLRMGMYVQARQSAGVLRYNPVGTAVLFCGKYAPYVRDINEATCLGDVYVYNDDRDIVLEDIRDVLFKEREHRNIPIHSSEKWMVANAQYERDTISNININLKTHLRHLSEIYQDLSERVA